MQIFFMKSLLSIIVLLLACNAVFTMFEVFGRSERRYDVTKLKKIHRINGIVYALFFIAVAYFCIDFIVETKAELSARATVHAVLALTVAVLFMVKIVLVKAYRQFYEQVKTIGLLIAVITFVMIGITAGYYLLITEFGTVNAVRKAAEEKVETKTQGLKIMVRTDSESVRRGHDLYESKCSFCHDPTSNNTVVGPGHKGILKNPSLPVSRRDATPENVYRQLRQPFNQMPSFDYLTDEEVTDIIAFLNTL